MLKREEGGVRGKTVEVKSTGEVKSIVTWILVF